MNKPKLIIGVAGVGKTMKLNELMDIELQNSLSQLVVLQEVSSSLSVKRNLAKLISSITAGIPNASIFMTLQSMNQLSPDDQEYAIEHFDVIEGVWAGKFVPYMADEILIEGIPVRLRAYQKYSADFFNGQNEQAVHNAALLANLLYGRKATLEQLHLILLNTNGLGKAMVLEALQVLERKKVAPENITNAANWFLEDYYNKERSTYNFCAGARYGVGQLRNLSTFNPSA